MQGWGEGKESWMREGGLRAEARQASAGPPAGSRSSCGGARALAAARAFPLCGDRRRRPPQRPKGTGLRG